MSEPLRPRGASPAASDQRTSRGDGRQPRRTSYPDLSPKIECRRHVDGLAAVPWDLIRDPNLGSTDKVVACVLASLYLPGQYEVAPRTGAIGRHIGQARRPVQVALRNLQAAGWILLAEAPGLARRKVVLLWRVPDDCEDLVPSFARGGTRGPRAGREDQDPPTPLFAAMEGGEP